VRWLRHTAFPEDSRVFRTNGGSLGWGLPAAVGAKIACPDRAVVAVVGDGTFHFTPQALWTSAREKAPVLTIVVDNSGYLAVKLSIERHLGVDKDSQNHPGTDLPALDHVGGRTRLWCGGHAHRRSGEVAGGHHRRAPVGTLDRHRRPGR